MDCRKFHKNLEDYLEESLDFPGRFGMERHAQQCISCGKDLSNAQRLRRIVRSADRVKAPADFEASVLNEIGKWKENRRFAGIRKLWIYGYEFPQARKLALASTCMAVLALGALYLHPYLGPSHPAAVETTTIKPLIEEPLKKPEKTVALEQNLTASVPVRKTVPQSIQQTPEWNGRKMPELIDESAKIPAPAPELVQVANQEPVESDYVEVQMIGPDNRPVSVRYTNKPHLRYGQNPQEYFIRNVSH